MEPDIRQHGAAGTVTAPTLDRVTSKGFSLKETVRNQNKKERTNKQIQRQITDGRKYPVHLYQITDIQEQTKNYYYNKANNHVEKWAKNM